jgi:hypothetical protein
MQENSEAYIIMATSMADRGGDTVQQWQMVMYYRRQEVVQCPESCEISAEGTLHRAERLADQPTI